jgi:hypothetical protein
MAAITAGYHAIDGAEDFWSGFEGHLEDLGYRWVADAPCTCPDRGRHGHMPECRWLRLASGGSEEKLDRSVQSDDRV